MSYYLKVVPITSSIDQRARRNEDDLSYEFGVMYVFRMAGLRVNIQQDDWVDSIKDDTKRELIMAYNSLNQDLKWNTKKKEKRLFRKGDEVISFENDLEQYWEY